MGYAPAVAYDYPIICEGSAIQDLNFMGVSDGVWVGTGIVDADLGLFDPIVSGNGLFDIVFTVNDTNSFVMVGIVC